MSISTIAKTIDELVHRSAADPFTMSALLYGCDDDGAYLLSSGDNPYELLEITSRPDSLNAVALVITGFASPNTDGEIRPSQHPERIRVRIVNCMSAEGFTTIMRRANTPDEVEDMGSEGVGFLREAIEDWWAQ
jgi:hypothetical protein